MSKKKEFVEAIINAFKVEFDLLSQSAKSAHEAATHEESRAEDSHDTRSIEAGYLAGAQSARLEDLKRTIHYFQHLPLQDFKASAAIDLGALIQVECQKRQFHYFVTQRGGGKSIVFEGKTVQLITPQTPLGEELMDKCVGDEAEVESQGASRVYKIIQLQ